MKVTTETDVGVEEVLRAELRTITLDYEHNLSRVLELVAPITERIGPSREQRSRIVKLKECLYKLTSQPTVQLSEDWIGGFETFVVRLRREYMRVRNHLSNTGERDVKQVD